MIDELSRRTFLQIAGAGAAGLWLPAGGLLQPGDETPRTRPVGKELVVRSENPFNAEGPLDKLAESFITPLKHFYVRCNGPIPKLKADDYRLHVDGLVKRKLVLSLEELTEKFKPRTEVATLMCAGNRRSEHSAIKKVGGLQWGPGPIGNARWTGVSLAAVLRAAGLQEGAEHVWFESLDEVVEEGKTIHFGASIPIKKALSDDADAPALLAYRMNGEPLPPEHGFPLRTIVPGFVGSRSVKWLGKIVVSDRPSENYFVARSYKLVKEGTPAELAATEPIYHYPVNSAICVPAVGAKLKAGKVSVAGYALPSGRRDGLGGSITKVELSADGGRTWQAAELGEHSPFAWRLWQSTVTLKPGEHRLVVRATANENDRQPEQARWNLKGYLYNGWHEITVKAG